MVTYGDSSAFQPPTPTQKAESRARLEQTRQENQAVQEQRQQAPGSIVSGSPQDIAVRAEAQKQEQQRMISKNIKQIGSSPDRYSKAREEAIRTGRFDTTGTGKQIPQSFVTSRGQRVERETKPMVQGKNEPIVSISVPSPSPVKEIERNLFNAETKRAPQTPSMRSEISLKLEKAQTEKAESGTSTLFGKTFETFTPTSEKQTGEVSSFLKVPFSGQKAQGGQVPSTSLADVFAFVPIGSLEKGAISIGKELSSFFIKGFAKEAPIITKTTEQVSKTGTTDIGLNVPKYTEKFKTEKNIQSMISEKMKTPPPEMARQGKEVTLIPEIEVKLGTGPSKVISTGKGGTSILEGTGKPPTTPTEKTVSVGKGLEQIVREKQVTKTVQKQKPEFEQKQLSKQEQFLKDQEKAKTEQTTKTEQQLKTKQEESLIQKTGLKYIRTQKQAQKQEQVPPIPIIKPRQTEKEKPKPLIPLFVPIQPTKQKQKQELGGVRTGVGVFTVVGIKTPPIREPTTPPTKPPPTEPTQTDKKRPPDLGVLGVGGGGGLVGKVSKSGARREFVGNVPEASIIGTYKRSELSYSERTIKKSGSEQSKLSTGKFVEKKRTRIL